MSDSKKRFYMLRRFFFANGTAMFGDGTSKFYWIYSCIGRFIMYCNWFAMLVDAVTHLDDLARTIETVCMVIPLFCCIWIDTFVSLNKRSLQELIDLTDQFVWEDCPVRDDKSGWLTMAGLIPKIQPFIFHLRWTTVLPHSAYMIHRAIKSRDLLGMNAWFPFDTRISPVHEIIIVLQIYCSFMYTSNFHAIMGLYATLVAIACTQLQKVRDLFLRLENRHPENRKQFSRCIEFHQTVLSFMSMMQSKLNVLLFGHFMIIIIGMAFASFGFVMSWGNIGAVYTVFLVFVGQLLLLGTYCMFGSELTDRAEDVKFAAYSCDWVGSPISEQRSLMFVMASANSEFKLLAGGFIPATKETMLAMLNQTFSYAMFLLNFKDVD